MISFLGCKTLDKETEPIKIVKDYQTALRQNSDEILKYTTDTVKLWFDDKNGQPTLIIKGTKSNGKWREWDEEMQSESNYDSLWFDRNENAVQGYFFENNDFYKLIGKPPTKTLRTYWLTEENKIKEIQIFWLPQENIPTDEYLKPVLEWAKWNASGEINHLYENGNLIPSRENARRWKRLLKGFKKSSESSEENIKTSTLDRVSYNLPGTTVEFLSSKSNGISYKLYISLPQSYNKGNIQKYPVLYLLDPDYSFAIVKNIVDHLSERNHLKEIIIVGIAYDEPNRYRINRTRDYTPTNSEEEVGFKEIQKKYSGGGPKFLSFIEKELIPFVQLNYRVNNFKAIAGHSYGGLFTSWILKTKPSIFDGYIAISPSLWYDEKFIFKIEDCLISQKQPLKIYFAVGDREVNNQRNMPNDLNEFVKKIKSKQNPLIEIKHDTGINETHNSIFPFAISNGIRFVFDGV